MAGLPILRVVSNDELARQEKAALEAEVAARQNVPMILGLTGYVRTCWDAARDAKGPIETLMLKAMRQRNGEYEADKLNAIRAQGGSEVYMMITEVKCRAAESWLRDTLLDDGMPPWDIQPTPIPEIEPQQMAMIEQAFQQGMVALIQERGASLSPQEEAVFHEIVEQDFRFKLLQAAQNRADRMKDKISDQFAQGGWMEAFNSFITDLVTFPAAFIKGPVVRRQRTLGWTQDAQGRTKAVPTERLAPEYERVDPFNIFPEPGITDVEDGYIIEKHSLTRTMLAQLVGVPGYDEAAIRQILELGPQGNWITDTVRWSKEEEERKFSTERRPTDMYEALEFWGKVSGKMLIDWGLTEDEVPDAAQEYDANVWVVGNYCIKAVLNYDPLGKKPYTKTSFIKTPGSFWGKGIPEIIEDIQGVCNASVRALVNNMGIASGPQVEVNLERIPSNEDITQIHPWKIWQVNNDPMGSGQPAVRFFQPNSNADQLMAVYEKFSRLADDHSGIPAYLYGNTDVQGAGRTSSGLSMLMGSAGKGIRQVVMYIDNDVTKPIVERQYIYNMRYDDNEDIKGDVDIIAKGAVNLAQKEQMNVRRLEFLNATANPMDMQIMGINGRAAILREIVKGLQMPEDEIIPSREKMMAMQQSAEQNQAVQSQLAPQPAQPQQQIAAPTPTFADGTAKGGMGGNMVSSRVSGQP